MTKGELYFLLGALYSRLTVRIRGHSRTKFDAPFPCTKAWIVDRLIDVVGGFSYDRHTQTAVITHYTLGSKEDVARLATIVQKCLKELPELKPLYTALITYTGTTRRPRRMRRGRGLRNPQPQLVNPLRP